MGFFVVLGGAVIVLLLFVANLVLAARYGRFSKHVTFALYGVASVIVVFNFLRGLGTESMYVYIAHGVVLFSMGLSLKRYIRELKESSPGHDAVQSQIAPQENTKILKS
jgi:asparagine N-glycosylation enzyme membrane subunit Stt3